MRLNDLSSTMEQMLQPGKGILAADESNPTIGKRFEAIQLENTEHNRRQYRLLLATTPELGQYVNGVILYEETFRYSDDMGVAIAELFAKQGIVPGIKVDKGLINLPNTRDEKVTQGLDGLPERLHQFKEQGARFAKWRNVYSISNDTPSCTAMRAGAEMLARYAASCQAAGIVPIVEPEVLMDGQHSIERCAEVSSQVLQELFTALSIHGVELEYMILKPSMVTSGKSHEPFSSPGAVAEHTINVFRRHVPAAVPTINFLSGGQTPLQATANLNAINSQGMQPWLLSFSYGRALQEDCLQIWHGQDDKRQAAQAALLKRARLNGAASLGEYAVEME